MRSVLFSLAVFALAESAFAWRCEIRCREGDETVTTFVNTGSTASEAKAKNRDQCYSRGTGFMPNTRASIVHKGCLTDTSGRKKCESTCRYWTIRETIEYAYGSTRTEAVKKVNESCRDTHYDRAITVGQVVCDD